MNHLGKARPASPPASPIQPRTEGRNRRLSPFPHSNQPRIQSASEARNCNRGRPSGRFLFVNAKAWFACFRNLPPRTRALALTCLYGLAAGTAAVAFQLAITGFYEAGLVRLSKGSFTSFAFGSFAIVVTTSAAVGVLLNVFCREAAGSGVPQLKVAYWRDFGVVPWRVVWVKFLAGVLSLGGGSSLGREGPSVQLAGALGSCVSGWLGEAKQSRRAAAAAGAAAGLAAAFNTPLAAVTFVLEEIIGDLNSRFLGTILLASVIGAFVVQALIGPQPAFQLAPVSASSWRIYALIPCVAAVASLVGVAFQRASLGLRGRVRKAEGLPAWSRPVMGGIVAWALGLIVFGTTGKLGVFGLGYDDLSAALRAGLSWRLAGVLLIAKFVATVACYGCGGCGGIFSPTLFLGGMTGLCLAGLTDFAYPLTDSEHIVLAVVGMSCCLGAVVRAPVTGILIVFEMTHEFSLVPPLMIAALVSQAFSRRFCARNFYDSLLEQDGHRLERLQPPRDLNSWQNLPVSTIANFAPVSLEDLQVTALEAALRQHPHQCFPVVQQGELVGVLTRTEARLAMAENRLPRLEPPVIALPEDTVRRVQKRLIDAPSGFIVVTEPRTGRLLGIVTLHDLLRAELSVAEKSGE